MSIHSAMLNLPDSDRMAVENIRAAGIGWKNLFSGGASQNNSGYVIDDPERAVATEEQPISTTPENVNEAAGNLSPDELEARIEGSLNVQARQLGFEGQSDDAAAFLEAAEDIDLGSLAPQLANEAVERLNDQFLGA